MPPDLSPVAQAAWSNIGNLLADAGMISRVDGLALRLVSEAWAKYLDASDEIEKGGFHQTGGKDGSVEIMRPAAQIRHREREFLWKFCREFGLTLSARSGLHIDTKQDDDNVADILGMRVVS